MPNEKFQNQYRIPSARAQWWNYGWNAAYFATICTANREHYFGEIVDGEMQLSEIGQIAHDCWSEIQQHFPFVILDEFVIMPNHVHGIVIIDKHNDIWETQCDPQRRDAINRVSTNAAMNIGGVATEMNRIAGYIINNPNNWQEDKFYTL